jgi:hypothetical protein
MQYNIIILKIPILLGLARLESILNRFGLIPYNFSINTYRYRKLGIVAEPDYITKVKTRFLYTKALFFS